MTLSSPDLTRLVAKQSRMWNDNRDRIQLDKLMRHLDARHSLLRKLADEPGVEDILSQMLGRLAKSFGHLANVDNKRILDIACGSNTSKAPAAVHINSPFGKVRLGRAREGYTALFEPWFCRILFHLSADAVGVDFGDLAGEDFVHHRADLGQPGALDFLPDRSFDAVQDSRLFGSPEFTAKFRKMADRVKVAEEIVRQEQRLLKPGGIVIHSDAEALLR